MEKYLENCISQIKNIKEDFVFYHVMASFLNDDNMKKKYDIYTKSLQIEFEYLTVEIPSICESKNKHIKIVI